MNFLGLIMTVGLIAMSSFGGAVPTDVITDKVVENTFHKERLAKDPLVGVWHCEKTIFEDLASVSIDICANSNGSMRVLGAVHSPLFNDNDYRFSFYFDWRHNTGKYYTAIRDGKTLRFQCDGKKLTVSGNPFELGFTTLEIANINTNLEFRKLI